MLRIKSKSLNGKISVIASKSIAHRMIICAALSDRETKIKLNAICEDVKRTISCMEEIGAKTHFEKGILTVTPAKIQKSKMDKSVHIFDVGESGTTFRFMLAIATAIYENTRFEGRGRLPERPIKDMLDFLEKNSVILDKKNLPFCTKNRLVFDGADIDATVSSQYISGLLLSSVLQDKNVSIHTIGEIVSKPYVDITLEVMEDFGVNVKKTPYGFEVEKQNYVSKGYYEVEADWSNAAFFLVSAAICDKGEIEIDNLNLNSLQGDKQILEILKNSGADVSIKGCNVTVKAEKIKPFETDVSDIPDLLPCLCILACGAKGKSVLKNASRLRQKESDRLESSMKMVVSLGAKAKIEGDSISIFSDGHLEGGTVDSFSDHRIAMSAAAASVICKNDVIIKGEDSVKKSYVNFFEDFKSLGGSICHL